MKRIIYLIILTILTAYISLLFIVDYFNFYEIPLLSYSLFPLPLALLLIFKEVRDPAMRKFRSLSIMTLLFAALMNTVLLMIGGTEAEEVLRGPVIFPLIYSAGMCYEYEYFIRGGKWEVRSGYLSIMLLYWLLIKPFFRERISLILLKPLYLLTFLVSHTPFVIPFTYYLWVIWRITERGGRFA